MSEQRRSFNRIPFDADTSVSQGASSWPVELIDISLNGILFKQPENQAIQQNQSVQIRITLADNSHIDMDTQLIYSKGDHVGCKCVHIDLDSITQLKRLIELNLGSDTFLERELNALLEEHGHQ
jgi:c-di-GMP-binding flagellar brake protein YcgR